MTRPTHLSKYWVNIKGLFNPKHIDRVNKLMTNNLLLNSQNKSDLDETFTEPSDGYCFKPNHIKPNQLLIFSKPAKNSLFLMKLHRTFRWVLSQTRPNQL